MATTKIAHVKQTNNVLTDYVFFFSSSFSTLSPFRSRSPSLSLYPCVCVRESTQESNCSRFQWNICRNGEIKYQFNLIDEATVDGIFLTCLRFTFQPLALHLVYFFFCIFFRFVEIVIPRLDCFMYSLQRKAMPRTISS